MAISQEQMTTKMHEFGVVGAARRNGQADPAVDPMLAKMESKPPLPMVRSGSVVALPTLPEVKPVEVGLITETEALQTVEFHLPLTPEALDEYSPDQLTYLEYLFESYNWLHFEPKMMRVDKERAVEMLADRVTTLYKDGWLGDVYVSRMVDADYMGQDGVATMVAESDYHAIQRHRREKLALLMAKTHVLLEETT